MKTTSRGPLTEEIPPLKSCRFRNVDTFAGGKRPTRRTVRTAPVSSMVFGANTPFIFIGSSGEPTTRPIRRVDSGIADLLGLTGESAIGRFPGPLEVVGEVL